TLADASLDELPGAQIAGPGAAGGHTAGAAQLGIGAPAGASRSSGRDNAARLQREHPGHEGDDLRNRGDQVPGRVALPDLAVDRGDQEQVGRVADLVGGDDLWAHAGRPVEILARAESHAL